jgi:hypothetical protein
MNAATNAATLDTVLDATPEAVLDAALSGLEPIDLTELTERASLLTRIDRKYVLPLDELDAVLGDLDPGIRVLDIDGVRASAYESVYFDTPDLTSFLMAAHPRRRRFKVRTRTYLDTAESYLEVKTRGGRGTTVKERLPYPIADRGILTVEGRRYAAEVLAEAGITALDGQRLEQTLITRYRRTTLFVPDSSSRATIDTDLSWVSSFRADAPQHRLDRPRLAIVETKSGSRASAVDRILWAHGHRPASLSKYGTGMAALRGDLPGNKWAPVLRRYFR